MQRNVSEGNIQGSFSNSLKALISDLNASCDGNLSSVTGIENLSHERTLPNVLTRIKYIIDQRNITLQQYRDADFKQFWLPDHLSKGCYDCCERFTPLRRRHHCRICGQIFCSKCCNKLIPGKFIAYRGDLRVCMYCYKVVLTYLQSSNVEEEVLADLRSLQDDLNCRSLRSSEGETVIGSSDQGSGLHPRRRSLFGFMEENYAIKSRSLSRDSTSTVDSKRLEQMSSERQLLLKDSQHLHSLWSLVFFGSNKLPLTTNRHRLKVYPDTFVGREFVQWMLANDRASSRESAVAIGQALLDSGFIFCVSQADQIFSDEHTLFSVLKENDHRKKSISFISSIDDSNSETQELMQDSQEPLWLKQIASQLENDISNKLDASEDDLDTVDVFPSCCVDLCAKNKIVSIKNVPGHECEIDQSSSGICKEVSSSPTFQSTITSVLNESFIPSASPDPNLGTAIMVEEVMQALKTLEPKVAEATAAHWQIQSRSHSIEEDPIDEQTRICLEVQKEFNHIWNSHESKLLFQLLKSSKLDPSWATTIVPLAYRIIETVKPDVRNESDDMDIRQYVQFKKVPGGTRSECCLINGTVCSKNVSHRQMKTQFSNPQILLIASHIDFYRSEAGIGKTLSDKNLLSLEEKFLKKVVDNICLLRPNIILSGEGISYLARERLMAEGITLVMNVKPSVLHRVSRSTQSQIIDTVDSPTLTSQNTERHNMLGMCHSFYLRSFSIPTSPIPKVLMFFDGCATHLGCTVILRGSTNSELRRVKRVMYFFIYALFNWQLEKSFLMDEFASVPGSERMLSALPENISTNGMLINEQTVLNHAKDSSVEVSIPNSETEKFRNIDVRANQDNLLHEGDDFYPVMSDALSSDATVFDSDECVAVSSSNKPKFEKEIGFESTKGDENIQNVGLVFKDILSKTVLSACPFIAYDSPYLLSPEGQCCPLRRYFPEQLYFSPSLSSNIILGKPHDVARPLKTCHRSTVRFKPKHSFVHQKITTGMNDLALRSALADFRARGCTIQRICHCEGVEEDPKESSIITKESQADEEESGCEKENCNNFCVTADGKLDALHTFNHQRISILFFSFSNSFQFTSIFCSKPRVLTKDFYGRNDVTLGDFLESYCFNPSYQCPSPACQAPSQRHVRKFVHESGCVEVLIRKMDSPLDEANASTIYMWTWCNICRQVSPVVPMSGDTWLFSFAKYLQLRFRDVKITRRGAPSCCHSIHQDHYHYFGQKDMVAVLKYNAIPLRELVIPPSVIEYVPQMCSALQLTKEVRSVVGQGVSLLAEICQHLITIANAGGRSSRSVIVAAALKYRLLNQVFKESIENIENKCKCCSLYLDKQNSEFQDCISSKDQSSVFASAVAIWAVEDQIVHLKRLLIQSVTDWNSKVQDLLSSKKKEEKERSKNSSGNLSSKVSSINQNSSAEDFIGDIDRSFPSGNKESTESASTSANLEFSSSGSALESSGSFHEELGTAALIDVALEDAKKISCSVENLAQMSLSNIFVWHVDTNVVLDSVFERLMSGSRVCADISSTEDGAEVSTDSEPDSKRSVKSIISTLWSSSADFMIKTPFPLNEHYILLPETRIPIVIYDDEPSSIIAKALASQEFEIERQKLQELVQAKLQSSSTNKTSTKVSSEVPDSTHETDKAEEEEGLHIDLQWSDQHANYYCRVLFVESFEALRILMFPHGDESFIRSLSRCVLWEARGGKSGSFFCKTTDDRFILKGMSRFEISSFLKFAPAYVDYMTKCKKENRPTILTRIVGVYRIGFKNLTTNKAIKLHLLVMENLFYRRNIGHKFDLKGSVSNRKVNLNGKEESEEVLMDENLLQMVSSSPFYLRPHSKSVLTRAIAADTAFLSQQLVMDYSLLVGVDEKRNELIVGIIDYIRTFTWDKRLETVFKRSVLGVGTGKLPTVISPELYRNRFCHAMENYFVLAPDRWTGLGLSFDS